MSNPKPRTVHKAGIRVLKAISASMRIQILSLLLEHGPMSYTEIMNFLKLDATRDAGRFAYHLRALLKADLIEPVVETKKYRLTDLGRRIIEITDEIEDRTYKRRRMLVRSSRLTIEEFDRNKIAHSLITEASVPTDLAQKIARQTEKRLLQFKTRYLTGPLIREIVNTILLEKHFEDYRHKLTRLGLPVHEVTRLIEVQRPNVTAIHKAAGDAVLEEYALLNILPRNISDAYLSGSLHLNNLGSWILRINEVTHSLQYFLEAFKPRTFEAALNIITNIVRNTSTETTGQQALNSFNVHLAPYTKGRPPKEVKEVLRFFIRNLNQTVSTPATIGLELLPEKKASYTSESTQLALLILETLTEENHTYPLLNPKVVVQNRVGAYKNGDTEFVLHKAHELAAESILVYFVNLTSSNQKNATYTASGLRLAADWQQDWEIDTQRTGNLDTVTLNLPRVAFEAKGETEKFFEILDDQLELAVDALEIKYQTIKKRIDQNLLPSLSKKTRGDQYFRLGNATRTVTTVGLSEAVKTLIGREEAQNHGKVFVITERILKHIKTHIERSSKKPQTRLTNAIIPNKTAAKRLARLDVEKYGWGIVKAQGSREHPCYSDVNPLTVLETEQLSLEERIHQLAAGGHLTIIEPETQNCSSNQLLKCTKQLSTSNIGFFTYNLAVTYCNHCETASAGTHLKCPHCSSTNTLTMTHLAH